MRHAGQPHVAPHGVALVITNAHEPMQGPLSHPPIALTAAEAMAQA